MDIAVVKTIPSHRSIIWARLFSILLCIAIGFVTSCGNDDDNGANDKPACQLIKQTATNTGAYSDDVTFTSTATYNYAYDSKGNIIEQTNSGNYVYSDGKTSAFSSSQNYKFDDKGFLLQSLNQYNGSDHDGSSYNSTSSTDYTYENDRLVKTVYASTYNDTKQNYVEQYQYDDKGRIIKYVTTYNNSSIAVEYSGDIVSKVTLTDGMGNVSSPFLQYNEKGLLIKGIDNSGGYSDENRYEYTSEGLVSREERWIDGKPNNAYTYEYDTKVNPSFYIYPGYKGMPKIPGTRADFHNKHNYTKNGYFDPTDDATVWKSRGNTVYIYDYNAQDFPTSVTMRSVDGAGTQTGTSTTTYEYANCQ